MLPATTFIAPLLVWGFTMASLPLLIDVPWLDGYRDAVPWSPEPFATPAGWVAAILVSMPPAISKYHDRVLAWRSTAVARTATGVFLLVLMGNISLVDLGLVTMLAIAIPAMQMTIKGWKNVHAEVSAFMLAGITAVVVLYAFMPFGMAVSAALYVMCMVFLSGILAIRHEKPVPVPPGFDWRNTPDIRHPGKDMCDCPRHRNRRENPGVLQLCRDCMDVYVKRPKDVGLSRKVRFVLWLYRNVVVGKFVRLRLVRDADDCRFCGSRGGGLRGRVMPPPDAR